jgi:hypothetical protein
MRREVVVALTTVSTVAVAAAGLLLLGREHDRGSAAAPSSTATEHAAPIPLTVAAAPVKRPRFCSPGARRIFALTSTSRLYTFDPATASVGFVGQVACPSRGTPFTAAVDPRGGMLALYSDGRVYRVSTADARCEPAQLRRPEGTSTFVMAFVPRAEGNSELFSLSSDGAQRGSLGRFDSETGSFTGIATVVGVPQGSAELAADDQGRLFSLAGSRDAVALSEIDPATGGIERSIPVPGVRLGEGWAMASWGEAFYLFTSPSGITEISRFDPARRTVTPVIELGGEIVVGAGAASCDPAR